MNLRSIAASHILAAAALLTVLPPIAIAESREDRAVAALDERMAARSLPEHVRRERLVTYAVVFTTMLGERAHALEEGADLLMSGDEFAVHMIDTLEALLVAPSNVPKRKQAKP